MFYGPGAPGGRHQSCYARISTGWIFKLSSFIREERPEAVLCDVMTIAKLQIWDRASGDVCTYLILLAVICLLYILRDYIRSVRLVLTLNGPAAVPILGNTPAILQDNVLERLANETQSYGSLVRIWVTILPYVLILEPQDIQLVLGSIKHIRKNFFYKMLDNFLGKGLITSDVETWRVHRKILQPAFHVHMLERFSQSFAECAERLVDKLREKSDESVNITSFVNDAVYDILMETMLGLTPTTRKNNNIDDDDLPFRKGQVTALKRITQPWLLANWIYGMTKAGKQEQRQRNDLFVTCYKLMKEKQEFLRKNGSLVMDRRAIDATRKISLLEYMVEARGKYPYFTDEDIVEECCTFMLAGQDSVGTATAMTLFLLANHPEWQRKCLDELSEIYDEKSMPPSMKAFKEMKCLEMCIKEALRLYPSVPLIARVLSEDVKIGKHILPAGCGVIIAPYSTHRLPHHYPDPHTFKPERFSPENSETRHPYVYLPFSAGPRNCIGYKFAMLEMKAMVSAVLRNFTLEPVTGKQIVRPKFRMTVRAQGGLWVKIKPQNQKI